MSKISIELNIDEFPILANFNETEQQSYIKQIFMTGYNIHFPKYQTSEYNHIITKIDQLQDSIKNTIKDTDIKDHILSLDMSLNKLIGLSSNSNKKGNFAENILENIFETRYGDIKFERKSGVAHSGDAWLYLPDNTIIILESKNYTTTINTEELKKLQNDMITHHICWGIMVSFNSQIQGMRELDLHTFIHNNEKYNIITISNLSNNILKLDLSLQIIRKLIIHSDKNITISCIDDINNSLLELNKLIDKNYLLRDNFYNMEQTIHKSLNTYYTILRDYQYDIENKIKEIINNVKYITNNTVDNNNYDIILETFNDKKVFSIITKLLDIIKMKNWILNIKDINNWIVMYKNEIICNIIIQQKKVVLTHNQIELTFNINKDNHQNFEIIKLL
jgi:hypothetical protein